MNLNCTLLDNAYNIPVYIKITKYNKITLK